MPQNVPGEKSLHTCSRGPNIVISSLLQYLPRRQEREVVEKPALGLQQGPIPRLRESGRIALLGADVFSERILFFCGSVRRGSSVFTEAGRTPFEPLVGRWGPQQPGPRGHNSRLPGGAASFV